MKRTHILVLEDDADRLRGFEAAVGQLGATCRLRVWRDAHRMIQECPEGLADAALISLDHDLNREGPDSADPGDGVAVAEFLARLPSICPVILHSSNTERVWSMHNALRFGGWQAERVAPVGSDWIQQSWLTLARSLLEKAAGSPEVFYSPQRPADYGERLDRTLLSLHGLALGDGIGEMMFGRVHEIRDLIRRDTLPAGPWYHTDDTEMALSIADVLRLLGGVHQDALARHLAWRYGLDPVRGYGSGAREQLRLMLDGVDWRVTSRQAFGRQGSMGNGSAMRVAPVGAWFADDLDRTAEEARASSVVTHMHPEGVAGAVATAVAAAMAWRARGRISPDAVDELFNEVLRLTPESITREGIACASDVRHLETPMEAAELLGNGLHVTCPDTVPFAVWAAAKYLGNFREAIAATASVGGDIDTNCAIVGGIVALSTGWEGLPERWLLQMEQLTGVYRRPLPPRGT